VIVTATRTESLSAVIVDDTPDLRLLLRITLEQDGDFRVVAEAENGLEGVRMVSELQPDLVLLDLAMPVMDGLEALPRIREVCPAARVVVLSGFEAETMAQRALSAGADGYLQKGTSPRHILSYALALTTGAEPPPEPVPAMKVATRPGPTPSPGHPAPETEGVAGLAALAAFGLLRLHAPGGDPVAAILREANSAAVTMLALPHASDGSLLAQVAPDVQAALVRRLPDVLAEGEARERSVHEGRSLDLVFRKGQGNEVVVSVIPAPRTDEANLLRQAISTTAHEIRNPVTLLSGVAQVVRANGPQIPPEQLDRLLGAVSRQSLILDRVTEDLLTAAQAGRGSLRIDIKAVDLAEALDDAISDTKEFRDVVVEGAGGVQVLADPDRLSQMMANLVSNAVKYGEAPYAVTVRRGTGDAAGIVHVDVIDSGPGVREEFRAQLFDEFSRAGNSTARGTGLGLFVVRSLAEAQGGRADYAPHEGGGSVFTVSLPAAEASHPVDDAEPTSQSGRPDSV